MIKKINEEIKQAMINKDASKRDVLRAVKSTAGLLSKEVHTEVNDEHVMAAIKKEMKALSGTLAALDGKKGVEAAVKDAEYRMSILEEYMPKMLTKEEVMEILTPVIRGLESPNMGAAMKAAMAELKGKADGKVIKEVVMELLKNGKEN